MIEGATKLFTMNTELYINHLYIVKKIAESFARKNASTSMSDYLIEVGNKALAKASDSYDPSRDIPFENLATVSVRNAMIKKVKKLNAEKTEREDLDDDKYYSMLLCDWSDYESLTYETLDEALSMLTDKDHKLLSLYFGLDGRAYKLTELSAMYNVSFQAISKQIKSIMGKLRNHFIKRGYTFKECA